METAQFLQSLVQSALFSQYGFQTKSTEAIFKATCLKRLQRKTRNNYKEVMGFRMKLDSECRSPGRVFSWLD